MDLVSAFSGIQQAKVANDIDYAVMRKAMSMQRQQGADALELLASAQKGASGGDPLVAQATGLGGSLDTYA
jgi:hypothetical protein